MTRGDVESKKCSPGGFYNGAQTSMRHSWEDALLILSTGFCSSRYLKGPKLAVYDLKPETTAIMFHGDQIRGKEKCSAREEERTFVLLQVSADIRPESLIPLIVSEFHQLRISIVRITVGWPDRPNRRQKLDAATITVMLQAYQA